MPQFSVEEECESSSPGRGSRGLPKPKLLALEDPRDLAGNFSIVFGKVAVEVLDFPVNSGMWESGVASKLLREFFRPRFSDWVAQS